MEKSIFLFIFWYIDRNQLIGNVAEFQSSINSLGIAIHQLFKQDFSSPTKQLVI